MTMASELFATKWICDFCGVSADTGTSAPPDGWLITYPGARGRQQVVTAVFETQDGRRFGECCPACQDRPLAELLNALAGRVLP